MTCDDHEHYEVFSLRPDQFLDFRLLLADVLDQFSIDRVPIPRLMFFGAA